MRGIVTAVACLLCAAALAASEKPPDAYQQAMKDLECRQYGPAQRCQGHRRRRSLPGLQLNRERRRSHEGRFREDRELLVGERVDDAVKLAQAGITHAEALEAARKAKDFDALMTAAAEISKTCGGCHAAHREKTADGSYEIK